MIPKQLFFIWIGDNKPAYVDFAVNAFKEVNPDFKVDLLEWKIDRINNINNQNLENKYDECLFNCINHILNFDKYQKSIFEYKKFRNRRFCQILCNILRLDIITKFGGIYLDCDTFPLRPFDNKLLSEDFTCYGFNRDINPIMTKDCYFIGSEGNIYYSFFTYIKKNVITTNNKYFMDDIQWKSKREKFYNCCLEFKYYKDNISYIDHFIDYTWNPKNNRTSYCKYDEKLYDKK